MLPKFACFHLPNQSKELRFFKQHPASHNYGVITSTTLSTTPLHDDTNYRGDKHPLQLQGGTGASAFHRATKRALTTTSSSSEANNINTDNNNESSERITMQFTTNQTADELVHHLLRSSPTSSSPSVSSYLDVEIHNCHVHIQPTISMHSLLYIVVPTTNLPNDNGMILSTGNPLHFTTHPITIDRENKTATAATWH